MKRLYLLRHAKSSREEPGLADYERPLAPRGAKAARTLAKVMAARRLLPALALCSAAARTRATWELMAPTLGDVPTQYESGLYLASAADLLHRLRQVPAVTTSVLMIGHNPGLHELALMLVAAEATRAGIGLSRLRVKFPTASLAVFTVPFASWNGLVAGGCPLDLFLRPAYLA